MLDVLVSGRIHDKPVERKGQNVLPFVVCKVRQSVVFENDFGLQVRL